MTITRKEFFRKSCISGACMCGFGSFVLSANSNAETLEKEDEKLKPTIEQEWLTGLLLRMHDNLNEEENRKVIKQLAEVHYKQLNMDEFLKPYENDLNGFTAFIEKEWGWKISYDVSTKIITADENKNFCVCPIVNQKLGVKTAALCYCSEGFAERMFSKVVGHDVSAKVISSIHRGDEKCVYEIQLSN